ncbi:MAG: alanine--tRNA ligase [Candidatus Pacebacteria bacterium CG10_big_fil_rev_8_21_14_0_10_42_12]|nr:alanine--tRNA ligase [Candidatus Paceibacterota bacterium]PIR62839.1 MAG: alanine--tRNA ligase [Candidatus Pacebacteria bacterium CG10_big_fil_rev_8_21_14_0_10_42_12]
MTPDELRLAYLDFMESKKHAIVPSASLVPENDPTTLFTGSGMQPMITYLLGEKHPKGTRIADSQRCFRSQDIEEVGDNRHTTYFEMLGNWSLGDYFKKEQLSWFFEFLTKKVGLDPKKLFVTVFRGNDKLGIGKDTESVKIWQELFTKAGCTADVVDFSERDGMGNGRIFYYDETKNWWSRAGVPNNMPAGEPGGPDSETFYDFGAERKLHENSEFAKLPCHVNCDCGRFLEIGNSVFMQYQKMTDGSFAELPQRNVDFGGGLVRIAAAQNNDPDVFATLFFTPITKKLEELTGKKYGESEEVTYAFRVIADHVRAAVMLASDGVFPSNKEQGYFSRRLLRRSIRYIHTIDYDEPFLADLVEVVAKAYGKAYPSILVQLDKIKAGFVAEEKKFQKALAKGLKHFNKLEVVDGESAFALYETYGFPFELTQELAAERGISLKQESFDAARETHAAKSREGSAGKFKGGLQDSSEVATKYHTATHLLHAALRKVLGTTVQQKGSNITGERLRFDFSFERALSDEEQEIVLNQVQEWIDAKLPVTKQTMEKEAAIKSGAIAFFSQKYPDQVSVYTVGLDPENNWVSKELCGGPHVQNTEEIGKLKIIKEQAVAAGVRRMYLQIL